MQLTVSIEIEVTDEAEFRQAAYDRAIADGLSHGDAATYLSEEATGINACAVMLFDIAGPVPGCSTINSSAE